MTKQFNGGPSNIAAKVHVGGPGHDNALRLLFRIECVMCDERNRNCDFTSVVGLMDAWGEIAEMIAPHRDRLAAKPIEKEETVEQGLLRGLKDISDSLDQQLANDEEDDVGHEFKVGTTGKTRSGLSYEVIHVMDRPLGGDWGGETLIARDETDSVTLHLPDGRYQPAAECPSYDLIHPDAVHAQPLPAKEFNGRPSKTAMRAAEEIDEGVPTGSGIVLPDPKSQADIARIIDEKMQPMRKVLEAADKLTQKLAFGPGTDTFETCHRDMVELRDALARLDGEGS